MSAISHAVPGDEPRGRFLRIADVMRDVGLSRSTIYRLELAGSFPRRVRISGNSIGWWSSEIASWMADRPLAAPG